jgi:hypothetical protein
MKTLSKLGSLTVIREIISTEQVQYYVFYIMDFSYLCIFTDEIIA